MDLEPYRKYLEDPRVWVGAAGVLVLIVLISALRARSARVQGRVRGDAIGRARTRLRTDIQGFRDDLTRAIATAGPVFRKVETETGFADVVGHWRKEMKHRIQVRSLDLGALKQAARQLGYDSMPISELEAHWRKVERQVLDYNSGRMDASKTPIASVKQLVKDLQSAIVMVNMCLTKYSA